LFWKNKKNNRSKQKQIFSLISDCHRNAFRINPTKGLRVTISNDIIPIIDISVNGIAFQDSYLKKGDIKSISIQLGDDIEINTEIKVIHLSFASDVPICGCQFKDITDNDRELINLFILQEQKKQIKASKVVL